MTDVLAGVLILSGLLFFIAGWRYPGSMYGFPLPTALRLPLGLPCSAAP